MSEGLKYIHKYKSGTDYNQRVTLLLLHGTGGDEDVATTWQCAGKRHAALLPSFRRGRA